MLTRSQSAWKFKSVLVFVAVTALAGVALVPAQAVPITTGDRSAPHAPAATITVNTTNDETTAGDGFCSLREAINNANSNSDTTNGDCAAGSGADTISLPAGTYTLALAGAGENANATGDLDTLDEAGLTINGAGATTTFINANGIDRAIQSFLGPLTLSNLTVENGNAGEDNGGGINAYGDGALTLTNVNILSNTATYWGGGVYAWPTATLNGGRFQNNTSLVGGGLSARHQLAVVGTQFISNTASSYSGGGVYAEGATTLNGGQFQNNTSASDGGGLAAFNALSVTGTQFISNTANGGKGGGVYAAGATMFSGGLFQNNASSGRGGGLAAGNALSVVDVVDTEFISNRTSAGSSGGGMYAEGATTINGGRFQNNTSTSNGGGLAAWNALSVVGTEFISNTATGVGGGVHTSGEAVLTNINVMSSTADHGGGIFNDGVLTMTNSLVYGNLAATAAGGVANFGAARISNSTIVSNTAQGTYNGGGGLVQNSSSPMELINSTVSGNKATGAGGVGGGLYNFVGTVLITDSTFANNQAEVGAGIYNYTVLTMTNGTITSNTGSQSGGIFNGDGGTMTLNNSAITGNTSYFGGGGILNEGALKLNNSTVSGNSGGSGGGIFNTGALTLNNSTVSGNAATYPWGGQGGGIFQGYSGSTATINNSTIAYNTVLTSTGASGIHIDFYAVLTLTNSIVANNGVNGNFAVSGTLTSQGYNLSDNWNGLSLQASDRTGDPLLAPLANNGGATWTHALLPGSPAIDAGNNATCMSTDQRGIDRPQGPACDMGAYEWLGFTLSIAAAGNGSGVVTPTVGAHSYWPGAVVALQATANTGSIFAGWSGNADCLDGSVTMNADKSCTATFTVNGYTLTPSAGVNGAISPSTIQTVNYGGSRTFTITANTGYHIADVRVDGTSQGAVSNYTFSNVTANHTITASFAINSYTLTPAAGPNGTITPSTPQTVNYGGSKTFAITANSGYDIADVRVDGVSQGRPSSYTFSNVAADHTITASFAVGGPQTRTVGVVSITADNFTDLGGGVTRATGNIRLGEYLFLTGASDSVLYTSTTLTATGKLTVRSGGQQLDVLNGVFRAPTSIGSGTLVGAPTYFLNTVADWPLVAGVSVSSIDIPASKVNATASLGVQVYDIDATVPVTFAVAGSARDIVYSGTLSAFSFSMGGLSVSVASGATVSNVGITIPSATLTLPSVLGGASGTITNLSITKTGGVSVGGSSITLPDIKIGDGSKIKITNATARLVLSNNKTTFTVDGTLNVNLPGNSLETTFSFTIQNGQMSGTVSSLDLTIAGAKLSLKNVQVSNSGLAVGQAALTLPASLGGSTTTVTDVRIDSTGLSIGGGSIQLADIKIGNGSKVKIVKPTAALSTAGGDYTFSINGTLQLRLPQNSQDIPISGSIDSSAQISATIGRLTLKLAGATLTLTNSIMTNSGLSVDSGSLLLPAKLGGVRGSVTNVVINADGLSIGGGAATFPIPNFTVGGFSVSNAQAGIVVTNGGKSYRLNLTGTIAIAVRGSSTSASGTVSVDENGNISGSVNAFSLALAGLTLNASNISINNDGSLSVGSAELKLPSGFGGASAAVYNVTIGSGEVSIGGGKFTLPDIKAGGFRLTNLGASLIKVSGGYEISGHGFATFPAVSGGGGCKGIGVSATLFVNALGQAELKLGPEQTNGLALKNASFNLECQIPIGTTGFYITGISGSVTLSANSTQVNVGIEIAAGRKIGGVAALSANAQAQLISDPFDLTLNGAVRVFIFQIGGARARVTSSSFSATLWIDMKVVSGSVSLNAWSKTGSFHMNGSGSMTVGFKKGSIWASPSIPIPRVSCHGFWPSCRYWTDWVGGISIPPSDFTFSNVGVEFGEFQGDRWGVKGKVSLLGYSAGFFVDNRGTFSIGNVDSYRLVQPSLVALAMQKWQAAQQSGLAAPNKPWEVDGIQLAGNSIIVNQPLTTTTDAIFALGRSQTVPTLTLIMPNNTEITPGSLPPNVDYTETMTYTRNLSPTGSTSQTLALADQSAVVRFTHAKTDLGAVDVQIDGATTFTGVGFGAESSDQVLSTGSHTLALVPAGSAGPILYSTMVSITGNSTHRLTAAGDVTHTVTLDLIHNPPPPPAGKATIRFAHASPDAPSLDVVLMDDGSVLFGSTLVMSVTAPLDVDAGAHSFGIYEAGSNQLLAQVSITLTDSGKYSLIAVGRLNGAPGLQLVAQADELPSAQVRLVNALAASQSIDLWTQGITVFQSISNTASSPYYQFSGNTLDVELKPAGDSSTSLFNGSFPLQANADQTLVALDYVTQTQAILLQDDNSLPQWGKMRVRFVNASPNAPNVDVVEVLGGTPWFSDIAYKSTGSYLELDGGTVMTLEVRDHGTASVLLTAPNMKFVDGYVYTLFLMGVDGGTPALQLVQQADVATIRDIQTQYMVHQAPTGTWGMKLNGDITTTDQYLLTMLGSNPPPVLSNVSAALSSTTVLTTSWQLTSDELDTRMSIYANPGPITTSLIVTDNLGVTSTVVSDLFTGQALATGMTSTDPNWVSGVLQTMTFDPRQLPSGTYHVWFEADDGRNPPVRRYAPNPIVVNNTATWPLTWTAVVSVTPDFRTLNVQWQPHPHADVDGYNLIVTSSDLTNTQVISVGNSLAASVTALQPGMPYSVTLQAYNTANSLVSQSQTVIGVPDGAPFNLTGPAGAVNMIAGQSQPVALTVTAGKEPYPGVVGLQVGCVQLSGAACDASVGGFTVLFNQDLVTPTLTGASAQAVITTTKTLPAGNYVVPIIASGNGLSRTVVVDVALQTPSIAVAAAPGSVNLGENQSLEVSMFTTGYNGAGDPIDLNVTNAPIGLLWSLDRATLLPGANATLAITDTPLLASGTYTVDIVGDDGLRTSVAHLSLTVSKPDFQLAATPVELVLPAGWAKKATFALDVTPLDGWTSPVTLSFDPSSTPSLGTVGLTRDPAPGAIESSLVVTPGERIYLVAFTTPNTPPGSYMLSVDAQGGGRQQTLDAVLTVRALNLYLPLIARGLSSVAVTSLLWHQ